MHIGEVPGEMNRRLNASEEGISEIATPLAGARNDGLCHVGCATRDLHGIHVFHGVRKKESCRCDYYDIVKGCFTNQ
jgi:hypothetical protein